MVNSFPTLWTPSCTFSEDIDLCMPRNDTFDLLSGLLCCTANHLCWIPELLCNWVVFRCCCASCGTWPHLLFVYIWPTDVQLSGPSFLSHYPASSLGIKICTPANKPWAIWWRTVWATSTVVYIQYHPMGLLNTFKKKCKHYLDSEKCFTVWNSKQAILILPQKLLVTEFSSQHLSLFFPMWMIIQEHF